MRALAILFALAACGDNAKPARDDAGTALAPCLAHPTDVPRPPTGPLPCELLPPGFVVR